MYLSNHHNLRTQKQQQKNKDKLLSDDMTLPQLYTSAKNNIIYMYKLHVTIIYRAYLK